MSIATAVVAEVEGYGALMEPSGRKRRQPVASGTPTKTVQIRRSATGGNQRQPFRNAVSCSGGAT